MFAGQYLWIYCEFFVANSLNLGVRLQNS
jgi:hypothetical protein